MNLDEQTQAASSPDRAGSNFTATMNKLKFATLAVMNAGPAGSTPEQDKAVAEAFKKAVAARALEFPDDGIKAHEAWVLELQKDYIKQVQEAKAKASLDAGAKPTAVAGAPAPPATPHPSLVILSFESTIDLVGKGAIIKIDGTSPKHELARVEVANALEQYFKDMKDDEYGKASKALGLKDGEDLRSLMKTVGNKIEVSDRKLLGKALRLYQEKKEIVADGKVGPATLEQLLAGYGVDSGINTAHVVGNVAQAHVPTAANPGHLGGKRNSYTLRNYADGAETDPNKNEANRRARNAMLEAEEVFVKLQNVVNLPDGGQGTKVAKGVASKVYTQKEHDTLKALFEAKGDKPAPIDTSAAINADQVKAFQKAFGLKADGVIGEETARALAQINLRLATDQVIDPSEIKAAVVANAKPAGKATPAK